MSGEELKKILVADGVVLSELATALGYQGDQWLHSALKAADVKSGLIERIAAATKKSVCHYYRGSNITAEGTNVALGDGAHVEGDIKNVNNQAIDKALDLLSSQLDTKDSQIASLIDIIRNYGH
jgi:hypothetical protein